ncbi:MAG: ribosomal protein S18-alanine N-acetyltransferase [Clostridiales bacterium]|nr:ribosomal protein S18-alanine N-acetyltransferase [Clostridiales bacterium]
MTDQDLVIRSADLSDIKYIMALEQGSIVHPWESKAIESLIVDKNKKCYVADLHGEVVGYVGAEIVLDECNIGNIVTHKDFRGRGFATEILGILLDVLKRNGVAKVFLEVEHDNIPAIALYEKHGFTRYGQRRDYYGPGKDAILMTKEL